MRLQGNAVESLKKTLRSFFNILPIIVGMLLASSLAVTLFPKQISAGIFGRGELLDAVIGATIGSVAAGHPLASYLLGGELLASGVGLTAVTALMISWVTVGMVQLPAEALMLGGRFAVYRNIICFAAAIIVSGLTVYTLRLADLL
jgi:hypothetical protein